MFQGIRDIGSFEYGPRYLNMVTCGGQTTPIYSIKQRLPAFTGGDC